MSLAATAKQWLKQGETPLARQLLALAKETRHMTMPCFPPLHGPLYALHVGLRGLLANFTRIVWTTPLFKTRVTGSARGLYLYSGIPLLLGPLHIELGENVRLSGITTLSGRASARKTPVLKIGNSSGIGWQTTIAVGTRVIIGEHVRIAGKAFLAGYPGHPLDPEARAKDLPEEDWQCGDIIIEDNVWLASGVTVMAGVTIGKGSVVAAGSVVTKDVPPGVLAAGVPAKIIRSLTGGGRNA